MAKQLTFSYNGKDYVLEFTRNTVRQMESGGFIADDKMALIERLAEMYNEPIKAMLDEPEEGNVEWTPSW